MARTRREKKEEAKRRIDDLIPTLPVPRFAPAPVRGLNLVLKGTEALAQGLVEADPLGIITEPSAPVPARANGQESIMMAMVNDPSFKLSPEAVDLINDDSRMVASTGMGLVEVQASGPGQFDRSRILPRRRTRKKTKTDKNMSKALREANARLRTKKGMLRKGKTQADVMRLAHRLRKQMK